LMAKTETPALAAPGHFSREYKKRRTMRCCTSSVEEPNAPGV
jgi:hypothetical protein